MDTFLRHAEQILETAMAAKAAGSPEYLIAVSALGTLQIRSDAYGWSLPAWATETGAMAAYRVKRQGKTVRVEGWSCGRSCLLTREMPAQQLVRPLYPTLHRLEAGSSTLNDLAPQVWNS